jgi:tryptophan-rich sensory protein
MLRERLKVLKRLADLGWLGGLVCALGAVLLAVLANLYILLARPFGATLGIPIEETGPVGALIAAIVPYVWLFLFAGMGTSFWLSARAHRRTSRRTWLVVILIVLCVGYPVYTGALNQPIIALIGNAAVIAVAAIAVWVTWPVSRLAAGLLVPVIAWVSLASVALVALITGQRF